MGVIGLKKFLKRADVAVEESIPYGSHLNIDANGWLFEIINSAKGLAIQRQYGGSYTVFDNLIRNSYNDLVIAGFTMTFYFDGSDSLMKKAMRTERNSKRAERWMAVYLATLCEDAKLDQSNLDLPPLTTQQFIFTLMSLGVSMVHCNFEADQTIAIACMEAAESSTRPCYCYGNDT